MRHATLAAPPVFALAEQHGARVTLKADTGAVAHVFVLEEDMIRLLLLPDGKIKSQPSWAVAPGASDIAEPGRDRMSEAEFACPKFVVSEDNCVLSISTSRLSLSIRINGFHCQCQQREGDNWRTIMEDRATQAYDFGWGDGKVHHWLARPADTRFYGLGERSGAMDRTGRRFCNLDLDALGYDAETSDPLYKSIPYLLIAGPNGSCHGAFYDNVGEGFFDLGQERDNYHGQYWQFMSESGDLDLTVIAGPDPLEVTKRFTWMTGQPAATPDWALGFSGSTMAYTGAPDAESQMMGFLDKLAEHDIGCRSFHFSSGYTSIGSKRYVFNWNNDKFPDPATFVARYAEAGVRLIPNIKPALLVDHPHYEQLAQKGFFVSQPDGSPTQIQYWDELGSAVDFTNPAAAVWWQQQVTSALLDNGITATWNDNNEHEVWNQEARVHGFGATYPIAEARPIHSTLMMRASRAAQLAKRPDEIPFLVTRSGMAGLHRYAQTWTGDNQTDWKTLRYNQKMALGLALCGVSNLGHDVGGFAGPRPDPELFLRWIQAGILMPRFSIHSWNDDGSANEPWMYPEILPQVKGLMDVRQLLVPTLSDLLYRDHAFYEPVSRPLWLDHPDEPGAWVDYDDHMLGRNLLVALILAESTHRRQVHFPDKDDWINIWTGERHAGRTSAEIEAPLHAPPPVFAREGSAMLVDLAPSGFARHPRQLAIWLFPPIEGEFDWTGYVRPDEAIDLPVTLFTINGRASREDVTLTLLPQGTGPKRSVTFALPPGDQRDLMVNGQSLPSVMRNQRQTFEFQLSG